MKREEMAMEKVFEAINGVFSFIGPLSDFLWEFPTNFDWYSSIPILGNISFEMCIRDRFVRGSLKKIRSSGKPNIMARTAPPGTACPDTKSPMQRTAEP